MLVRKRTGFTLVELLVVVVIISMLVALLVPAVVAARRAAQQADCTNRQAQLSKAVLQYEMNKQYFPGYVNVFGTTGTSPTMNWIVVCLQYMGREDLWKEWRDNGSNKLVLLEQLTCPGDTPSGTYPLSYVANCGKSGADGPAYGVFHDHTGAKSSWDIVSASNIPDGSQATILLGENVQAGPWNSVTEYQIGMLWQDSAGACGRINRCLDDTAQDVNHARPASRHGGGAVFSFCDGHQQFIREDISYTVYQHLMTPDSNAAGLSGSVGDGDY